MPKAAEQIEFPPCSFSKNHEKMSFFLQFTFTIIQRKYQTKCKGTKNKSHTQIKYAIFDAEENNQV